ncbi:YoaK family protein [Leuconostoc fallax]|uniref:YoaK family protein n=1 Tax=Leuconostoc fallax TaxID=1251 RepID=UPI0020919E7D|nr:YoaK family protein [Leuconostoc fallax]MCO6184453.1 DUF1275 domain-containing protein [Leuconostoc fallax]
MSKIHPIHEKFSIALLVAMNSGFVDAYTFQYQDQRFASLQSGNVIQAAVNFSQGNMHDAVTFVWPIICFALGVSFNTIITHFFPAKRLSIAQHSVLCQLIGITLISLLGSHLSETFFITMTSFIMAIQADTFTKMRGLPYGSVMATGNIRNIGKHVADYLLNHTQESFDKARLFFSVVMAFLIGALLSGFLSQILDSLSLLGSSLILLIIYLSLFDNKSIHAFMP